MPRVQRPLTKLAITSIAALGAAIARCEIEASSLLDQPVPVAGSIVRGLGDLDGDGALEWLIADPTANRIEVHSGAAALLYAFEPVGDPLPVAFGKVVTVLAPKGSVGPVSILVSDYESDPPIVHRYALTAKGATLDAALVGDSGTRFGFATSFLGDLDGDLVADFAIGDPTSSNDGGFVFVYSGAALTRLAATAGAPGEELGYSLSDASGDLTGDGIPDFVVGAPAFATGSPGRAYIYSTLDLAPAFSVTNEAGVMGDGFGATVLNLGRPPIVSADYIARFAIGAPNEGGAGVVRIFKADAVLLTIPAPTPGKQFGRILSNAYNTRDGSSNELAVADYDHRYVYSSKLGLTDYANAYPGEVSSMDAFGNWNATADNYFDSAVAFATQSGWSIDVLSGKTLFYKTPTLFLSAATYTEAIDVSITANVGSTHAGRPFLLLMGFLLDPSFTGSNQSVGGPPLYLPFDFDNSISLFFLTLPPAIVPPSGIVTYGFDIDPALAPLIAAYSAATNLAFFGVLQTGTTLAATNPVPLASILGG